MQTYSCDACRTPVTSDPLLLFHKAAGQRELCSGACLVAYAPVFEDEVRLAVEYEQGIVAAAEQSRELHEANLVELAQAQERGEV